MQMRTWKILLDESDEPSVEPVEELDGLPSLDAVNLKLPPGVYTTFRTYHINQVIDLTEHFKRLKESALLSGLELNFSNILVRETLSKLLEDNPSGCEARIRLTLLLQEPTTLFVSIEPLKLPPASAYVHGVKVITSAFQRENAKSKNTKFIATASAIRESLPANINEVIMLDQSGNYLEGLSSNFFAVLDGTVWTAEEGVLSGLTRQIVITALKNSGVVINLAPVNRSLNIEEAFITSVSRGVLPVCQIDNLILGDPGTVTRKAMTVYANYLKNKLETL